MRTLRGRLLLAIALSTVFVVAVTLAVGAYFVRRGIERAADASLARQAELLGVAAERNPDIVSSAAAPARAFLRRIGEGLVVYPLPLPAGVPLPADAVASLDAGRPAAGRMTVAGRRVLFAAQPAGGRAIVVLRDARVFPVDTRPFVLALVIAAAVGVAVAALVSFVLAGRITRPVRQVAEASRRLAAGERVGSVPVEGNDELATLARSFNAMASDLARAKEAEGTFLLSVSHDLKTPLTAIRGYAEALQEGVVEPSEAAATIARESTNLERLVQDLLDLARLQRRAFDIRSERVDLVALANDVADRFQPRAREFGISLNVAPPPAAPVAALADHDRLLQVVSNLVENALRATPAGGSVVVEAAAPTRIMVRDTGPGIAPEDLPHAFERFYLHGRYGKERAVGSGLGLAIVHDLTQAMGGRVAVSSRLGAGSVFAVDLPAAPA